VDKDLYKSRLTNLQSTVLIAKFISSKLYINKF
jgi:hypothetical protein